MVILETIICHAAKVEFGASFAVEAREGNWSRKGFFFLAPGGSGLLCWNTWSLWDPLGSAPPLDGRGTTSDSALPDVSLQSRFLSWCSRGLWDPPLAVRPQVGRGGTASALSEVPLQPHWPSSCSSCTPHLYQPQNLLRVIHSHTCSRSLLKCHLWDIFPEHPTLNSTACPIPLTPYSLFFMSPLTYQIFMCLFIVWLPAGMWAPPAWGLDQRGSLSHPQGQQQCLVGRRCSVSFSYWTNESFYRQLTRKKFK